MSSSAPGSSASSNELAGSAKLEEVTKLMGKLSVDLQTISLSPHQRDALLEQVKIYGRDPTNADPIFTREGIETLTRHAFNSPYPKTSRNALRCLANAMLLKANTRQIFIDLGYESKACNKLKNDSRDDEFLLSRIILLTTYGSKVDIEKLIDQHHLAEYVCDNIGRHAKQYVTKQKKVKELDPMEDMALVESLKLLFNLSHFCPQRSGSFSPALPHILTLLNRRPISLSKPLDPPIGNLVNAVLNIPLENKDNLQVLFPKSTPYTNVNRFIEILDKSTRVYSDEDMESLVSPLITLLRKVYEAAPKEVQSHIQKSLLPSNEDRQQPLGRSESLSSRLLRQSINPGTPKTRDSTSSLLFELSGKDAKSFVQNVGYGYASGFLMRHKVPMPENALESWTTSGSESSHPTNNQSYLPVNPITGQTLESEPLIEEPEMSQEEKEREAEKLFVLFERLKRTGVMSVKNPVETALSEGRFLELDDDAESE